MADEFGEEWRDFERGACVLLLLPSISGPPLICRLFVGGWEPPQGSSGHPATCRELENELQQTIG